MSEKLSTKESLLKACKEQGRLSAAAESCSVGQWVDCSQCTNLPAPHTIVPIVVQLGGNRAAFTYGFWTADEDCATLGTGTVNWFTISGTACGWVREWYAVPRSARLRSTQ